MSSFGSASGPAVAIIGAGVIGLSIGWRLAAAGVPVSLFERGEAGRGASWAAAGMLAAGSEVEPGEQALFPLLRRSQAMWPGFAADLERASGIDVALKTEGTLTVALTRDDLERLRQTERLHKSLGIESRWLDRAEALELEPHLNPRLAGALVVPGDHQVDNRLVVEALRLAFVGAGGVLREKLGDVSVRVANGRAAGVEAEGRIHAAPTVIVAAGAWSRLVPGLPPAAVPPVRPVKGQMLALSMDPAAPLVRHVVWAPKSYIVPRRDGRLIVGATVEEKGFDDRLTAGGMLALLEAAWRAIPGIEELPIAESWTGFRPGSRDDAPILGRTAVEGLVLATGHHRNGILLAPLTAKLIFDLLIDGVADPMVEAFSVARFADVSEGKARWKSA